jgi:hypothetical protein
MTLSMLWMLLCSLFLCNSQIFENLAVMLERSMHD